MLYDITSPTGKTYSVDLDSPTSEQVDALVRKFDANPESYVPPDPDSLSGQFSKVGGDLVDYGSRLLRSPGRTLADSGQRLLGGAVKGAEDIVLAPARFGGMLSAAASSPEIAAEASRLIGGFHPAADAYEGASGRFKDPTMDRNAVAAGLGTVGSLIPFAGMGKLAGRGAAAAAEAAEAAIGAKEVSALARGVTPSIAAAERQVASEAAAKAAETGAEHLTIGGGSAMMGSGSIEGALKRREELLQQAVELDGRDPEAAAKLREEADRITPGAVLAQAAVAAGAGALPLAPLAKAGNAARTTLGALTAGTLRGAGLGAGQTILTNLGERAFIDPSTPILRGAVESGLSFAGIDALSAPGKARAQKVTERYQKDLADTMRDNAHIEDVRAKAGEGVEVAADAASEHWAKYRETSPATAAAVLKTAGLTPEAAQARLDAREKAISDAAAARAESLRRQAEIEQFQEALRRNPFAFALPDAAPEPGVPDTAPGGLPRLSAVELFRLAEAMRENNNPAYGEVAAEMKRRLIAAQVAGGGQVPFEKSAGLPAPAKVPLLEMGGQTFTPRLDPLPSSERTLDRTPAPQGRKTLDVPAPAPSLPSEGALATEPGAPRPDGAASTAVESATPARPTETPSPAAGSLPAADLPGAIGGAVLPAPGPRPEGAALSGLKTDALRALAREMGVKFSPSTQRGGLIKRIDAEQRRTAGQPSAPESAPAAAPASPEAETSPAPSATPIEQMAPSEFLGSLPRKVQDQASGNSPTAVGIREKAMAPHRAAIEKALAEGQPVSEDSVTYYRERGGLDVPEGYGRTGPLLMPKTHPDYVPPPAARFRRGGGEDATSPEGVAPEARRRLLPREVERLAALSTRWWMEMDKLAPGVAADLRVVGREQLAHITGDKVPNDAEAAWFQKTVYLLADATERGRDLDIEHSERARMNILHELGHGLDEIINPKLRDALKEQWQREVAEKSGPLYADDPKNPGQKIPRPGVDGRFESDFREYLAERLAIGHLEYLKHRADQGVSGRLAESVRGLLRKTLGVLAPDRFGRQLGPFTADHAFREFLKGISPRMDVEGAFDPIAPKPAAPAAAPAEKAPAAAETTESMGNRMTVNGERVPTTPLADLEKTAAPAPEKMANARVVDEDPNTPPAAQYARRDQLVKFEGDERSKYDAVVARWNELRNDPAGLREDDNDPKWKEFLQVAFEKTHLEMEASERAKNIFEVDKPDTWPDQLAERAARAKSLDAREAALRSRLEERLDPKDRAATEQLLRRVVREREAAQEEALRFFIEHEETSYYEGAMEAAAKGALRKVAMIPAEVARRVGEAWLHIAGRWPAHQLPRDLPGKTPVEIAAHLPENLRSKVEVRDVSETDPPVGDLAGESFYVKSGESSGMILRERDKVYVNTVNTGGRGAYADPAIRQKAGLGPVVYQLAQAYARNAGLKFMADPMGVSEAATPRRWAQMLSAATRFGDTSFIDPKPGKSRSEVPGWTGGKDVPQDVGRLALLESEYAHRLVPKAGRLAYDPASDTIRHKDGTPSSRLSRQALLTGASDPRNTGVGEATLRRAVVTRTAAGRDRDLFDGGDQSGRELLPGHPGGNGEAGDGGAGAAPPPGPLSRVLYARRGTEPVLARGAEELDRMVKDQAGFKNWYSEFKGYLRGFLGEHADYAPLLSEFLNVTSAATTVESNVPIAVKQLRSFILTGEVNSNFPAHQGNLERAIRGEEPSGPKISKYSAAVFGDESAVPVDRHVAQLLFGQDKPTDGMIRVANREAARIAEQLGWTPREVQAAMWAANQARKGEKPQSYDSYLDKYRNELHQLFAFDRAGEGRGLRSSEAIGERVGAADRLSRGVGDPSRQASGELGAGQADAQFARRDPHPGIAGLGREIAGSAQEVWRNRGLRNYLAQTLDGSRSTATNAGREDYNRIRLAFSTTTDSMSRGERKRAEAADEMDRRAAPFIVEAKDANDLRRQWADARAAAAATGAPPEARRNVEHFQPLIDHALRRFGEIKSKLDAHTTLMKERVAREKSLGVDVSEIEDYVTRVLERPDSRKPNPMPFLADGGSGGGGSKYFTKERVFDSLTQAIGAGYKPESTDIAQLDAYRSQAGERVLLEKAWRDSLTAITAPDGLPLVAPARSPNSKPAEGYRELSAPNGAKLNIHQDFFPLMKSLFEPSALRGNSVGRVLLRVAAGLKHRTLVFDTFHIGRVLTKQAFYANRLGAPGLPIKGFDRATRELALLEYRPQDLQRAVRAGDITQEMANWARANRADADLLTKNGLNVGRFADELTDFLHKGHGPVASFLSNFNEWVFQKLSRSAILAGGIEALKSARLTMPTATAAEQAAFASRETNQMFGNLQNQGIFRNKTLQDILRLVMLAPQWVESQHVSEARMYGQLARAPVDLLRGKAPGNLALYAAKGVGAMVIFAQLANLYSRGQFTWDNKEEGRKLDAFVSLGPPGPDGKPRGMWFNPFSTIAEHAHQLHNATARGETPIGGMVKVAGYKLGPLGRAATTIITGKDFQGRPYESDGARLLGAAQDLVPIAIPLSPLVNRAPGETPKFEWPRPGAGARQAIGSMGFKLDPNPSAVQLMNTYTQGYTGTRHEPTPSRYIRLKQAVDDQDRGKAVAELARLIKADMGGRETPGGAVVGKQAIDDIISKKINPVFNLHGEGSEFKAPAFTRGSKEIEAQFIKELTPERREVMRQALQELQTRAKFYASIRSEARQLAASKK